MSQLHTKESLMKKTVKQLNSLAESMNISGLPTLKGPIVDRILQVQQLKQEASKQQPLSQDGVPSVQGQSEASGSRGKPSEPAHHPIVAPQCESESSRSPPDASPPLRRIPTIASARKTNTGNTASSGGGAFMHQGYFDRPIPQRVSY